MKVWYWSLGDSRDYHCDLSTDKRYGGAVSLTRKGAKDHFCAHLMAEGGWSVWDIAMLLVMGSVCYRHNTYGEPEDWYDLWLDTLEVC